MLIALDHIIIGVNNLEQATEIFAENLGLLASGGRSIQLAVQQIALS